MLQVLMLIAEEYVTLYWIIGISLSPFEIVFSNLDFHADNIPFDYVICF